MIFTVMSGCMRKQSDLKPPAIRYGEDPCAECRMIISEPKFAAVLYDGREWKKFDDIGCLETYQAKPSISGKAWVHDYATEAWIEKDLAIILTSDEIQTPMGYGKIAKKQ
jgi:copper chaperone NosL